MHKQADRKDLLLFWIAAIYVWSGALLSGYFYEVSFLASDALLFLGVAVCGRRLVANKQSAAAILPLAGLILLCWLSASYAVDGENAALEAARISGALPLAAVVLALSQARRWLFLKQWAWVGSFLTVWGALFGLFRDGRLESTMGYANVLALLLLAGAVIGWKAYRERNGNMYLLLVAVQAAGLLLTGSRAVLLLLLAVSATLATVELRGMLNRREHRNASDKKGSRPEFHRMAWAAGALPVVAAAVAATILGSGNGISRLGQWGWNAPELSQRRIYWKDGWELMRGVWYKGLGGGGWPVLRPNDGNFAKYVHQYYLQLLLDAGIGGLLLFAAFVGMAVYRAKKAPAGSGPRASRLGKATAVILPAAMLLHAGFDIDFAYPLCFCSCVVFLLGLDTLALDTSAVRFSRNPRPERPFNSADKHKMRNVGASRLADKEQAAAAQITSASLSAQESRRRWQLYLQAGIGTTMCLGFLWLTVGYGWKAEGTRSAYVGHWEQAVSRLNHAEQWLPWAHSPHFELAKAYVRAANETGNRDYAEAAEQEMKLALDILPEYRVYQTQMSQLKQSIE